MRKTIIVIITILDSKNPAFVLSDKNLKFKEKVLHVLSAKWCWGLVLLAIFIISLSNTLIVILWPKQQVVVIVNRNEWGAQAPKMDIELLDLPVKRVTVTDSGDGIETCTTKV